MHKYSLRLKNAQVIGFRSWQAPPPVTVRAAMHHTMGLLQQACASDSAGMICWECNMKAMS
jgi:hypothetical protein